jgi:hypothetical protein
MWQRENDPTELKWQIHEIEKEMADMEQALDGLIAAVTPWTDSMKARYARLHARYHILLQDLENAKSEPVVD